MGINVLKLRLIDGGAGHLASTPRRSEHDGLRVAIASQDGKALNAHFGFAKRLMVYDVTRRAHRFVQALTFVTDESELCDAESEDKIGPKIAALAGCHLLFVLAIGPPAAAKVIRANILPVKVAAPETIESVISRVQTMMKVKPAPWLQKILTETRKTDESSTEAN